MLKIPKLGATQSIHTSDGNTAVHFVQVQPRHHPQLHDRHPHQSIQVPVLESEMFQNRCRQLTQDPNMTAKETVWKIANQEVLFKVLNNVALINVKSRNHTGQESLVGSCQKQMMLVHKEDQLLAMISLGKSS